MSARAFPTSPVVGVGAVVSDGDRVLLVKRAHEPLKGQWSLPGGAVDVGETLEHAVAREVHEETGLTVRVGPVVDVLDRIHRNQDGQVEYHFVLVDYLCTPTGGVLSQGSDAEDVAWVKPGDLPRYGVADITIAVIRRAIAKA